MSQILLNFLFSFFLFSFFKIKQTGSQKLKIVAYTLTS